jgi:hypothetical protein
MLHRKSVSLQRNMGCVIFPKSPLEDIESGDTSFAAQAGSDERREAAGGQGRTGQQDYGEN